MTNSRDRSVVQEHKRLKGKYDSLLDDIDDKQQKLQDLWEEHSTLVDREETLGKSIEVVKQIVDQLFYSNIEAYEDLVVEGLNEIFFDQQMDFMVDVDSHGANKTAGLYYRKETDEGWTNWRNIDDSCGGSIRCVVDLITRIFMITQSGRERFVMMDESLSDLSAEYVPVMVDFLDGLSDRLDFDFLFITHDERFIDRLDDNVYRMESGELTEVK